MKAQYEQGKIFSTQRGLRHLPSLHFFVHVFRFNDNPMTSLDPTSRCMCITFCQTLLSTMTNRHPFQLTQVHTGITMSPQGVVLSHGECILITAEQYLFIICGRCIFISLGGFRSTPMNGNLGRWVLSYSQSFSTVKRCTPRHIVMPFLIERVYQVGVYQTGIPFWNC